MSAIEKPGRPFAGQLRSEPYTPSRSKLVFCRKRARKAPADTYIAEKKACLKLSFFGLHSGIENVMRVEGSITPMAVWRRGPGRCSQQWSVDTLLGKVMIAFHRNGSRV